MPVYQYDAINSRGGLGKIGSEAELSATIVSGPSISGNGGEPKKPTRAGVHVLLWRKLPLPDVQENGAATHLMDEATCAGIGSRGWRATSVGRGDGGWRIEHEILDGISTDYRGRWCRLGRCGCAFDDVGVWRWGRLPRRQLLPRALRRRALRRRLRWRILFCPARGIRIRRLLCPGGCLPPGLLLPPGSHAPIVLDWCGIQKLPFLWTPRLRFRSRAQRLRIPRIRRIPLWRILLRWASPLTSGRRGEGNRRNDREGFYQQPPFGAARVRLVGLSGWRATPRRCPAMLLGVLQRSWEKTMFARGVRRIGWAGLLTVSLCAIPACQSPGGAQHTMPCGGCGHAMPEATASPPSPSVNTPPAEHSGHRP